MIENLYESSVDSWYSGAVVRWVRVQLWVKMFNTGESTNKHPEAQWLSPLPRSKDDGFVSSLIPLCIPMWVCSNSPEISSLGELQLTKMWTKEKEKQSEIQGKNRTVKTDVQAEPKHQEAYCEVPLQQSWITNQAKWAITPQDRQGARRPQIHCVTSSSNV